MRQQLISDSLKNSYLRNSYISAGMYPNTKVDYYLLEEFYQDGKASFDNFLFQRSSLYKNRKP